MKKILFIKFFILTALVSLSVRSAAQNLDCEDGITSYFLDEVYKNYRLQTLRYAIKQDYNGTDTKLFMDVYRPGNISDDVKVKRPVVMLLFGGGFKRGSRNSSRIVAWAEYFVRRGYVVCAPTYRLGWPGAEDNICGTGTVDDFIDAMYRAGQDARSAVDFIKSKENVWSIDPEQVFVQSISAGALAALTWIYDHPKISDPERIERLGPLTTDKTNSDIKALVSIAGGMLKDFTFSENELPLFLIHGSCDGSVPFVEGRLLDCLQYPVVEGSWRIFTKAVEQIYPCSLNAYCGFKHEFENSTNSVSETDRTINYLLDESVKFIHSQLCDQMVDNEFYLANPTIKVNPIDSCRNFEAYDICPPHEKQDESQIDISPTHIKFENAIYIKSVQKEERRVVVEMYNLTGHQIFKGKIFLASGYNKLTVSSDILNSGLHFVNIFNDDGSERLLCKKILVESNLLTY